MNNQKQSVNYGNWVALKFIYIPAVLAVIFSGLSFISPFFLIGTVFFLVPAVYFIYAYRQFSPSGGNLQEKLRNTIFGQLDWNGNGILLDIGCGNGALTVEAAQKYPQARVTGIDYWGGKWAYSKESCEENARIAGVSERTLFQKAGAAKLPFADCSFDAAISNFVFHEVQDVKDKRVVLKEALRIVKKDGLFVFQDLFFWKAVYGEPEDLLAAVRSWGIQEVNLLDTRHQPFIPALMKLPFMVGQIGILYGRK